MTADPRIKPYQNEEVHGLIYVTFWVQKVQEQLLRFI